jgi:hypothetical protein
MSKRTVLAGLAALALYGAAIGALQGWEKFHPVTEYLSVPPASTARTLGNGYDNMVADGLYLQFINYFGKHLTRDRAYHNLMPVLDTITNLDPRFQGSYHVGALALGDAGRLSELEALVAKSVAAMPGDWQVAYNAGMSVFVFADKPEDYMKAAEYFRRAAALPGAEPKASYMLARAYHVSDRRDLVVKIWLDLFQRAPSREARAVAARSLQRLGVHVPDGHEARQPD